MTTSRYARPLLLLASVLAFTSAPAASNKQLEEAMTADGLQQIKVKGIDVAYAKPGATLAGYTEVQIDPFEVSFRKDFDPTKVASRMKYSAGELERIRTGVGTLVREEFVKELEGAGYKVVTSSGPNVLRFRAAIANLYVNAPDTMEPGRTRTYVMSAGEMTLVAELSDSETGALLARVVDRREARDTGMLTWSNSATNSAEARNIARSWAKILRKGLDAAKGIGK